MTQRDAIDHDDNPPGNVAWRGMDAKRNPVAVVLDGDGKPRSWFVDSSGIWTPCDARDIYVAWALHERAVAAAWRAYRIAHRAYLAWMTTASVGPGPDPHLALEAARDALRALGVEP